MKAPLFKINSLRKTTHTTLTFIIQAVKRSTAKKPEELITLVNTIKAKALELHKTNPLLKNSLDHITYNLKPFAFLKTKIEILRRTEYCLYHTETAQSNLADFGVHKIKRGMTIYVHGYSSSVVDLLLKAKSLNIPFEVVTTESHPYFTGYLLASVLAKNDIHVNYYADLALRLAVKRSDIVLLGADTISEQGQVFSSIGSELVAEIADRYDVPIYVCTDSWKCNGSVVNAYENKVELRPYQELWSHPPKKVSVMNFGFEKIHPKLISGVITEVGIYKPSQLISEIKKHYPWISI